MLYLCWLLEIIDIIIVNNNVNIDPWGTPLFIGKVYHCTSSSLTDCLQLVEYYCCEFHSNGSWLSHWSVCVKNRMHVCHIGNSIHIPFQLLINSQVTLFHILLET